MSESGLPFDDIRELIASLPEANREIAELTDAQVRERMGADANQLGAICKWYARWSGRSPVIARPVLTLFAGTHACEKDLVPKVLHDVTEIAEGSAAVNRLCHSSDLGLKVLDLALQIPVADILEEAALDEKSCAGTIAFGMEAIAGGADLLCVSAVETGPGVSSRALLAVLTGTEDLDPWCRDVPSAQLEKVGMATTRASRYLKDPLELLRNLGGRETAAITGAILAARAQHIPVVISGPTAIASALLLARLRKDAVGHCMLAQATGNATLDAELAEAGVVSIFGPNVASQPAVALALAGSFVRSAGLAWQENPGRKDTRSATAET